MTNNPDALRRFLKGWFATVVYMKEHKDDAIRLSRTVTQLSPDIADKVYDIEMPMYFTDGHFDPKAIEVAKQSIIDTGQATTMPDNKVLFTEEFLN